MTKTQFKNSRGEAMEIEIDKDTGTGHIRIERNGAQQIPIAPDNLTGYVELDQDETDELVFAWVMAVGMPKDEIVRLDKRQRERKAEEMEECAEGMHSWINEVGLLPPDTECTRCGELYGHPK